MAPTLSSTSQSVADALLGERGKAADAIDYALDVACAALCAEAVGAMAELQKITVDYLKTRAVWPA